MPSGIIVKENMPYGKHLDISDRLKHVRGRKKKAEFAKILGIPQPNLSKYESGRMPPADVMQKIADYGGVTVKWLLTGKEEKKALEQARYPAHPSHIPPPGPPVEIQEFLLAQVLRAVEEFWGGKDPGLEHRARVMTALYNYCARSLEPPSCGLDVLQRIAPAIAGAR
jgi:transcriptional regulator with XRE-family HTH domain